MSVDSVTYILYVKNEHSHIDVTLKKLKTILAASIVSPKLSCSKDKHHSQFKNATAPSKRLYKKHD